ncbi:SMP-30/gluconolactonase/LRE family protein [Akkermansiaceae bacterium]|nr:SMP-30/gluconolactonase/LRE family protein [Akkermansiaceae bacterium]MDA9337480.1 SMP-30/gluconolactonase/LRE family protein [bacterium]MDB0055836.1 SMP-30/gluconolactonase/LRE family protein [Akkermansiaceae bacterium]MDB4326153.1 SMP-30/gluconolactonase/LRE family protein [bacterium]MDB4327972.1 SMP-30/gluconolactonase/LRE family protein [Akkermansiaceae bacterium]
MKLFLCLLLSPALLIGEETRPTIGSIEVLDPALEKLIASDAKIEVLASGFDWSEGPAWDKKNSRLLFSDVPQNKIYQWSEKSGLSVYLSPSGYTGPDEYSREPGSNGLAFDKNGLLHFCEHGDRRVSALTPDRGGKMTVADRVDGKRFNSPNDLCLHPDGSIYFTDPPYGLPQGDKDPRRETGIFGVYRIAPDGKVTTVISNLDRPNGVALSPDSKTLYIAQSQGGKAWILSYPVKADGSLGKETLLYDATPLSKELPGAPDGLKTDTLGNIWCTGPGGVLILTAEGKLLGRILTGQRTANCGFGDDGSTLYMTADSYLLRVKTNVIGTSF